VASCEHNKTALVSKYEELLVHRAHLKTTSIFNIFLLNWPNLKLSADIIFLIFCAVHVAAENQWPASQVGQLPDYIQYHSMESIWIIPGRVKYCF
jgi:hypothetical protein